MAFTLNPQAQLVFFSTVFGQNHPVTLKAKSLIGSGVSFETSMYAVKATWHGNAQQVSLTTGTSALMKHSAVPAIAEQNKKLITEWINTLPDTATADPAAKPSPSQISVFWDGGMAKPEYIPTIKAIRTVTGLGLAEAKALAEKILDGKTTELQIFVTKPLAINVLEKVGLCVLGSLNIKQTPADAVGQTIKSKPVPQVIHLRDAKALGQKVHGTSTGSVYHCIAYSQHVKLAARLSKGGGISIRTEWTDSPTAELQKLQDAGVSMKSNYGSIHFDSAGVPVERTIGAFLVGVGIKWQAAVMNGEELVIGDK